MKSIRLILFFIGAPFLIYSQVNPIDSVVIWHCRDNTFNQSITIDSFDVNGLLINTTYYSDDTAAAPSSQILYTYSSSFRLLQMKQSNYQNSVWVTKNDENWQYNVNDSLLSYTNLYYYLGSIYYGYGDFYLYDSLNRRIEYVHQKYVDSLNALINDTRVLYSYDTINHIKIETRQNYDYSMGIWVNYSRQTISFDMFGKKTQAIFETWVSPGVFSYSGTRSFYYLPNDSIEHISSHSISYDSTVTQFEYDSSGYLIKKYIRDWSSGTITSILDSTNYFYDSNHNLIASNDYSPAPYGFEVCYSATNNFDNLNRIINYYRHAVGFCGVGGESGWNVYNTAGFIDSLNKCSWSMGILMCSTCSLEYISLTSVGPPINKENEYNVFPNPAENEITIFINQLIRPIKIEFFDNLGRTIKKEVLFNKVNTLSISSLSQGIYFISIEGILGSPFKFIKL